MPNIEKYSSYVDAWKSMWEPDLEAIAYNGASCDPTKVDSKVLQWARQNCACKPHFLKVINESASYGWRGHQGKTACRMGVPRPFVRDHYKELGRVVTLENGISHRKWKVSFGAPRKNPSWLQGWRSVADDNSLRPGDVMIFVLVGHSHFRFHIFDEEGNIPGTNRPNQKIDTRENTARAMIKAEPTDTYHSHQEHVFTDSEDELKLKKLRRLFDPDLAIVKLEPGLFQTEDVRPPSWANVRPNEQIMELALREMSTVPEVGSSPDSDLTATNGAQATAGSVSMLGKKNAPNSRQCLKDSSQMAVNNDAEKSVSKALPEPFVTESNFPAATTRLMLVDCTGKSWEMYSRVNSSNEISFHRKYWGIFSMEHFLEEGDVCVFQLDQNEGTFTMSVRIFRVLQLPGGTRNFRDHYQLRPNLP